MKFKRTIYALLLAVLIAVPVTDASAISFGGGRSGGFSGGSKSYSSGGSKVSSGGSKSYGSGGSKSYSSGSKPTLSKPSSGSRPLPKPPSQLVPRVAPPKFTTGSAAPRFQPPGRSYGRDYSTVTRGSYTRGGQRYFYSDPYGPSYFGYYHSPYYYLWLYAWLGGGSSRTLPPAPSSDDEVDTSLLSYMQVIQAMQALSVKKSP